MTKPDSSAEAPRPIASAPSKTKRKAKSGVEPLTRRGPPGLHLKHRDGAACCHPFQFNPDALTADKSEVTCTLCRLTGEHARNYFRWEDA